MEKINEKQMNFVGTFRLERLIPAILCIIFLLCPVMVQAQQDVVKGTVKDAATGEMLIGVTVMVKGTTIGTLTDINGQFTLKIPSGQALLSISFIGYKTQEVTAAQGSNISIAMDLELNQMQEVVVVGYGVQKKESVVGAITQVNNETLLKSGTTSVTNAIAGKLSGVLTIQNTGEPGANSSEIVVRGLSSWNGSQPLVLVDGVERDFSNIDPNEINTISVLKDASATAVFGAKGANGVIIVTTKRGSLGKPQLDFSAAYGTLKASGIPDHISSYTTMSMLNVARMNDGQFNLMTEPNILNEYRNPSTPLNALQYPDVDWFKELSVPFAPVANANLNISGGTNFVKYFASLGYQYEGDFFVGLNEGYLDSRYKNNRFNYRANVDFSLTGTTLVSLNLGGDLSIKNQPSTANSTWETLYMTGPSRFPAYFPDWVLGQVPDEDYPGASGWRRTAAWGERFGNPYTNFMDGTFRNYTGSTLFTDLILDQKLDFIVKGLSAKGKVSLSTYYNMTTLTADYRMPDYFLNYQRIGVDVLDNSTGKKKIDEFGNVVGNGGDGLIDANPWQRNGQTPEVYNLPPVDINVGGLNTSAFGGKDPGYYTDLYYEASLNYANTFGKHSVSGLALLNRQQKNTVLNFPFFNEALVGRFTYDYSHKYLVEVNLGYTGSERFAPGNRFGFFPSGAFGWTISEEPFFKTAVPWMNKLKVRYSDGLVGSDKANSRWLYISEYYTQTISSVQYIREDLGANISAQWEEARKRDIGLEIGVFKNLLTFNIDVFDEQRSKMLLSPQSVTFLVGNSFKDLNMGSLKKHGIEIETEFNKTTPYGLNYFIRGIFGFNENRVIYKDDLPYSPEYAKAAGKPLGMAHNSYPEGDIQAAGVQLTGTGYFTSVDDIHNNPTVVAMNQQSVGDYMFLDYNSDGILTVKDKFPIKGSDYPPITYSLASGVTFKGFDLNFMFQGNVGKYVIFNNNFETEFLMGDYSVHASQLDYWRPDNQDVNHATLHFDKSGSGIAQYTWGGGASLEGYNIRIPGRFWRNADYLRLKDLYLGYTFNSGALKSVLGASSLHVYATGNNLLTFTKLIEGDPERKNFERGFYPLMMTVKLGVKLSF